MFSLSVMLEVVDRVLVGGDGALALGGHRLGQVSTRALNSGDLAT